MSKLAILVTIITFIFCVNVHGQSKENTAKITKKKLTKIVNRATTNYVMFNIKKGKLYILDAYRNALKPKKYKAPADEVFTYYTVSNVLNKIDQSERNKIKLYKDETGAVKFDIESAIQRLTLISEDTGFCPPGCSKLD